MKKSEFLRELKINLEGKIGDDELENILMDYDDIFESGKADNKTEDEISDMIGSPALVARNILDEWSDNREAKSVIEGDYPVAPLGKRVMAFAIDYILSLVPLVLLSFIRAPRILFFAVIPLMLYNPVVPIFIILGFLDISPQPGVVSTYVDSGIAGINIFHIVLVLISFIFFWLYGTLSMIILKDRTIGMRLMNIRVVKRDGRILRPLDVFIRQFVGKILLAGLTWNISYIVSFFWAAFSNTHNTIHDKLVGTLVVEDMRNDQ